MKKIILLLFTLMVLASCANSPKGRTLVQPVVLHPPKPDSANLRDITWRIWNYERMVEILEGADPTDSEFSWWVLDARQYQNFILDVAEIKRYIEQQNLIIQYYRNQFPNPTEITEE